MTILFNTNLPNVRHVLAETQQTKGKSKMLLALLLGLYMLVWLALPSQNLHGDGLNELLIVESPTYRVLPKHPAAEPSVWLLMRGLAALGSPSKAIRPTQVWNGAWMTLALLGVSCFAIRAGRPALLAVGAVLILAGLYSSIHLAVDPFLFYWPPGLALMTWTLVFCRHVRQFEADTSSKAPASEWRRWTAVAICLILSVLYNPMTGVVLPLSALLWLERNRAHLTSSGLPKLQALLLLVLPPFILYATLRLIGAGHSLGSPFGANRAPFGAWTSSTLPEAWLGFSGSLMTRVGEAVHLGAFQGDTGTAFTIINAGLGGLALATLIIFICLVAVPKRLRRMSPWISTALGIGVLIVWWAPAQRQFWLLPVWLLTLGVVDVSAATEEGLPAGQQRLTTTVGISMVGTGILLWTLNGISYVWPAATQVNLQHEQAEQCAAQFAKHDLLFLPRFGDPYIDYFGNGVRTTSMLGPLRQRRSGQTTFERLAEIHALLLRKGGSLYFQWPAPGQGWVSDWLRERADLDYSDKDFARIQWGRTAQCGYRLFRQVVRIQGQGTATPFPSS